MYMYMYRTLLKCMLTIAVLAAIAKLTFCWHHVEHCRQYTLSLTHALWHSFISHAISVADRVITT